MPADDYWVRGIDYGSFERTIMLPESIDSNAIKATYRMRR
ncbi:MAG: hypothetical protein DME12_20755 [Candidatus Rokuibacteriota bacterium]|nr:MAG: hypothetical protein DME12_20755 [Candidatus Rokubacteria bacterium]PYM68469.1 MAG: hypothetical protein DME11_00360 [Candidatus Rokubacteria bacterium]PYN65738.1 MAG: hypothetical protein DMD93_20135 [Candidatus Rokubacteria bacterium]